MPDEPQHEAADTSPLLEQLERQIAALERRHKIGRDRYCGLTPAEMSRAVIVCHGGPRRPGEPAGSWPATSEATVMEKLREEYGPTADIERLRVMVQFFDHRIGTTLGIDWRLPREEFDHAVATGLARHYPELTDDARRVIAGNSSYSHAK
jgi:hypothetical protein